MVRIAKFPISPACLNDDLPDEIIVSQLFEVTHDAMTRIVPLDYAKEDSYRVWRESYENRIRNGSKYILIFENELLKGYIAYKQRYKEQDICIEDIIVAPAFQGNGITAIRLLYAFMNEIEDSEFSVIRTYTNKLNMRMQNLLSKAGFSIIGYTDRGVRYTTTKEHLLCRLSKTFSHLKLKNIPH